MKNALDEKKLPPVHVIGLGPGPCPSPELLALPEVREAQVLAAGKAVLAELAGHPALKLPVTADIDGLVEALRRGRASGLRQTVLCSGDPLFFGLGGTLSKSLGPEALAVHPGISCLQAAAALLGLPWEGVRAVSLHGRADYLPLAHALAAGAPVVALTDAVNSPERIAAWMRERGLVCRALHILEDLALEPGGAVSVGRHLRVTVDAILGEKAENLNGSGESPNRRAGVQGGAGETFQEQCRAVPGKAKAAPGAGNAAPDSHKNAGARRILLLEPPAERERPVFGFADAAFAREKNLLTKGPVRAVALAALGIAPGDVVWDLGAGCGSLAVEAARLACRGAVYAVERDPARRRLIAENRQRFGAANLEILAGEMPGCLPPYDSGLSGGASCAREAMPGESPFLTNAMPGSSPSSVGDIPGGPLFSADGASAGPSFSAAGARDGSRATKANASQSSCLDLPAPDAVFLGGGLGGGRNTGESTTGESSTGESSTGESSTGVETLRRAWAALKPGGRLVAACVLLGSLELARKELTRLGARLSLDCIQAGRGSPLAGDLRLEALNPVFLIRGEKPPFSRPDE